MSDEPNELGREVPEGSAPVDSAEATSTDAAENTAEVIAVADPNAPVILSPQQFIEQARAQERLANDMAIQRLCDSTPAVAALVAERDALRARVAELEAATSKRKAKA